MAPLMCTQNTLFHIDYGTPLVASKSTDYRTSTGKNHGFRPSVPQYFDCRVKARVKPELLDKDIALRNEFQSTYAKEYRNKPGLSNYFDRNDKAAGCASVEYTRNVEEKLFTNPPPPKPPKISEMKDSYGSNPWIPYRNKLISVKCDMPETYRAVQPNIRPEDKGYYKHLDIYLTENRSKYVAYSSDDLDRAQEDMITIYNASGKHKGLKEELPGKLHGYKNVYDKRIFNREFPNRLFSGAAKLVPNFGMSSEYRTNFLKPAHSDFYPYVQENGIYYPETISGSGAWQDLSPPGMYCSENCHIGTGWPVRSVVDINAEGRHFVHSQPCCTKI